jgi:hypothetical protein
LTGANPSFNPNLGNITFDFYTGNKTCTGTPTHPALDTPESTYVARTVDTAPLAGGQYSYRASFAGDDNYNAVGPSSCEPLDIVPLTSDIATTLRDASNNPIALGSSITSFPIHDYALITTQSGFAPTGNVTFRFFHNDTCTGIAAANATLNLDFANTAGGWANATSFAQTNLSAGAYAFDATYNGDVNNLPKTSDCEPFYVSGIKIVKKAKGGNGTETFDFTVTGNGLGNFSLTPDIPISGGYTDSTTFIPLAAGTGGGIRTITETAPTGGWLFTGVTCDNGTSGTSTASGNNSNLTATVSNLVAGDLVTCTFENTAPLVTRTQGFWATHPELAQLAWFGGTGYGHTFPGVDNVAGIGDTVLCCRDIDTLGKLMGGFWSNIAKKSTGVKRSNIDQARMQLLQQLLAAELNASAFGSSPTSGSFASWESAFCGNSLSAIKTAQQQAASFNTSGDNGMWTPGINANSQWARQIANYVFWDVPVPCP